MRARRCTPHMWKADAQGGAAQGIGWALNEEYIYGDDGRLQNPGYLDYRVPVCSDLPRIDTQILEIPNPNHPSGVRGVGETSIVPPLAAIAIAVSNAAGVRLNHIPMCAAAHPRCTGQAARRADGPGPTLGLPGRSGRGARPVVEIAARDIGELFRKLAEQYPRNPSLHRPGRGSVDRRDHLSRQLVQPLPEGAEIFLLPRIAADSRDTATPHARLP